jgi:hypothetical protein
MFKNDRLSVVNFRGIELDKDPRGQTSSETSMWLRGILMSLALFSVVVMAVFLSGR